MNAFFWGFSQGSSRPSPGYVTSNGVLQRFVGGLQAFTTPFTSMF